MTVEKQFAVSLSVCVCVLVKTGNFGSIKRRTSICAVEVSSVSGLANVHRGLLKFHFNFTITQLTLFNRFKAADCSGFRFLSSPSGHVSVSTSAGIDALWGRN